MNSSKRERKSHRNPKSNSRLFVTIWYIFLLGYSTHPRDIVGCIVARVFQQTSFLAGLLDALLAGVHWSLALGFVSHLLPGFRFYNQVFIVSIYSLSVIEEISPPARTKQARVFFKGSGVTNQLAASLGKLCPPHRGFSRPSWEP